MPPIEDGSPAVEGASNEAPITNTADTTSVATDASPAPSSGAPQGETKESLLDAVLNAIPDAKNKADPDALKLGEEAPASDEQSSDKTEQEAPEPEVDLDKDPTKEELSRYHSRTRKRIEKLLAERNAYREDANVAKGLRDYLQANDIAKEDFQLTLDLASAMRKGDFRAFLEGVAPYVQLAQEALGLTLPADLQQQVQQGYMTTEAASHMARERYGRIMAEQNAQRLMQQQNAQRVTQQQADITQSVEQAVSAWEAATRQSDPDYARKEEAVKNFLWAVVRERGAPQSPEQAVEIAKEAYARANNVLRSFTPAPKPTKPVPSSINRTAGAKPEPKSLMDAAMLGLERARR